MSRYHLVDGAIHPADAATINARDRGFMYGDAAFETMRVYAGEVFAWEDHLDRLEATCSALSMGVDLDRDRLSRWVDRLLEANELAEAAVRLSVTRGVQPGTLQPRRSVEPTIVAIARALPVGGTAGATWEEPAAVEISAVQKIPDAAVPASAKTHNYLNGILARLALAADEDEAIMLDADGHLAEGTTSNLFLVEDGRLVTPTTAGPVLPGITRETVIALAAERGIEVADATVAPERLARAEEAFLTNTTWEVRPIGAVDGAPLSVGPLSHRLGEAFADAIAETFYG